MNTILVIAPAERRMLDRMINATGLIPEQDASVEFPVMSFRGVYDLRTAMALMDKNLLIHLGSGRFRMTEAAVAPYFNPPPHWGRA